MTSDRPDRGTDALLRRVVGGDQRAEDEVVRRAPSSASAPLLVAAALLTGATTHLDRARATASSSRDRQVVVLAETYLRGDADRLDVLVRDHLVEHPDHLLAAWIAGRPDSRTKESSS